MTIAVAVADAQGGEARFVGEIANSADAEICAIPAAPLQAI